MPAPLFVVALKTSAAGGFAASLLEAMRQWAQQGVDSCGTRPKRTEEEEEEPGMSPRAGSEFEASRMVEAFAVGTVLGNFGAVVFTPGHYHVLSRTGVWFWTEVLWLPLHAGCLAAKSAAVADEVPRLVGYAGFASMSGYALCAAVPSLRAAVWVQTAFAGVCQPTTAALVLVFVHRHADLQWRKRILAPSPTTVTLDSCSIVGGAVLGTLIAASVAAGPFLPGGAETSPLVPDALGGVLGSAFLYCSALSIENSIVGKHPKCTGELDSPRGNQVRNIMLDVLPLGALPYGFLQGHRSVPIVLLQLAKAFAAGCACVFIAKHQGRWDNVRKPLWVRRDLSPRAATVTLTEG